MISYRIPFLIASALLLIVACEPDSKLPPPFPHLEGCLFGYMSQDSNWAIEPRFHGAQYFSEGLAAVREEGLYGYIDPNGDWTIEPRFDYAEPFEDFGIAKAYLGDKVIVINRKGKHVFSYEKEYTNLNITCQGKSVLYTSRLNDTTHKKRYTLITSSGQEIDIASNKILKYKFGNIYTLVQKDLPRGSRNRVLHLNEKLEQIPSLAGASTVSKLGQQYALATWKDQSETNLTDKPIIRQAIIDIDGTIVGEIDSSLVGKILIGMRFFEDISIARIIEDNSDRLRQFILIRPDGSSTSVEDRYTYINAFQDGVAIGWVSDTLGYYVLPDGKRMKGSSVSRVDYKLVYHGPYRPSENGFELQDSYRNLKVERKKSESPCFNVDRRTPRSYPIAPVPKGNPDEIFQIKERKWSPWKKLDSIRFDTLGYFDINPSLLVDTGGIQVIQNEDSNSDGSPEYFIVNATSDTVMFSTLYGSLLCSLEAQEDAGDWKPIETFGGVLMCGNSYGHALLPPGKAWQVKPPTFKGSFKTKMRMTVTCFSEKPYPFSYAMSLTVGHDNKAYSETIDGEVNPGQLWR